MKSLIRVSSIFIVLSIAFASETKEEMVGEVQVNNTEVPDKQLLQSDVAPIDIDQIKKIRFEKSVRDKKHAVIMLNEQKKKKVSEQEFFEDQGNKAQQNAIIKRWSDDIRSKFSVGTLKGENGKSAIKLPPTPKTN